MLTAHVPATANCEVTGGLSIFHDSQSPLIRVVGEGFFSPSDIEDHFRKLAQIVQRNRIAGMDIKVVVDLRQSTIQSHEGLQRIATAVASIYRATDKVAILVMSSLAKLQMRRMLGEIQDGARIEYFVSADAAETWLCTRRFG